MKLEPFSVPVNLYTSTQIRAIEQTYAELNHCTTYPLMEAAGKAVFERLIKRWPKAKQILVVTGKGNNGGDGYIVAGLAAKNNIKVTLSNFCAKENIKGDAKLAYQSAIGPNISQIEWSQITAEKLAEYDVIIDALLGTGIQGEVREPLASAIRQINQAQRPVLAIDIPSGLNADTGSHHNGVIFADLTLTFIGYKQGMMTGESANYIGELALDDLGLSKACFEQHQSSASLQSWFSQKHKLTPRAAASHKGDYGHCLVIGGSTGMAGAAILAATAAARSGSGLTSARLESDASSLLQYCPEVMAKNVAQEEIINQIKNIRANSLVIGPGLGQSQWAKLWLKSLTPIQQQLEQSVVTNMVWDADALNWLSQNPNVDESRVLTPHPGEAARLLNITTLQVNQNRFWASQQIAQQYGGICVLKGAGTVISNAKGAQVVCAVGNPGMATGGMGDVLSGIIGGLLAQGFSRFDAAVLGVCIHGEAADRVAGKTKKYRGMLASDLFEYLPELLNPNCR